MIFLRSKAIRNHWGYLVRSGTVKRDYKEIQLSNVITLATRVRICVLKVSPCKVPNVITNKNALK